MSSYKNGTLPQAITQSCLFAVVVFLSSCQLADNTINGAVRSDGVKAVLTFSGAYTQKTYESNIIVSAQFSKPVEPLLASHFSIQNAAIVQIQGSGTSYMISLTPQNYGPVSLQFVGDTATQITGENAPISIEYTRFPYPIRTISLGSVSYLFRVIPVAGTDDQIAIGKYSTGTDRAYVRRETNDGQIIWERAFQFKSFNDGLIVGATLFVSGQIYFDEGVMTAIDLATGTPLWARTFGKSAFGSRVYVDKTTAMADGGFTQIGASVNVSLGPNGGSIINTDSAGVIDWQKRFDGDANYASFSSGLTTSSDEIVAVGSVSSGADLHMWFLKLANDGTELVNRTFNVGSGTIGRFNWIEQMPDGNYLLNGLLSNEAIVVKVDGNGDVLWSWKAQESGVNIKRVKPVSDGQIIGVGSISSTESLVLSLSGAGQFLWAKRLPEGAFFHDFVETQDHSLKIVGHKGDLTAFVTKINLDGSVMQYDCDEWSDVQLTDSSLAFNDGSGPPETTSSADQNNLIDQANLENVINYGATPSSTESLICEP